MGLNLEQDFRISVAGAQEKTAKFYQDCEWKRPIGATATTPILKPQLGQIADPAYARHCRPELHLGGWSSTGDCCKRPIRQ